MADRRLAELPCQCHVLRVIKMLIPEKDDFPFQKGRTDIAQLIERQRFGKIDPADFRPDMQRERYDIDGACGIGATVLATR